MNALDTPLPARPDDSSENRPVAEDLNTRLTELTEENTRLKREIARLQAGEEELRRTEQALRASETRMQAILDNAPVCIWGKDPEGRILLWNRANALAMRCRPEEAIGKTAAELFPEEMAQIHTKNDRQVLVTGEACEYESQVVHDDEVRHYLVAKFLVQDPDGAPQAVYGIARDISRRKRLEEQLLQSRKMEGIGRLAGGIAHDFNNILTVVTGYTDMTLHRLAPTDPLRGNLEQVLKASERAAGLTRQLLAFARKQIIAPKVVDLNDLTRGLDRMLHRLLGEDIDLMTELSPTLWSVRVDPGQVEQIVINLAVNARDAMPNGGRLTIETANMRIGETEAQREAEFAPGDYVCLSVRDTGEGMTEQVKAHLFEPFFTTKEPGQGAGLGLALCYGIVKQSGGHITVTAGEGTGTAFHIYLPRVDPIEAESPSETQDLSSTGRETILVVEDEELVRKFALTALRAQGYTVLEASSGAEALQVAAHHAGEIHLLLTDVVMPHMNGSALAEQLSALYPGLKTLFASGYTDDTIFRHGILNAEIAFLPKPYTPSALAKHIRNLLDEHS